MGDTGSSDYASYDYFRSMSNEGRTQLNTALALLVAPYIYIHILKS